MKAILALLAACLLYILSVDDVKAQCSGQFPAGAICGNSAGSVGIPRSFLTGTGVMNALLSNVGSAGSFIVNGGVLGTPSSGTVTNLTGTASININGTVGATTPNTAKVTSLGYYSDATDLLAYTPTMGPEYGYNNLLAMLRSAGTNAQTTWNRFFIDSQDEHVLPGVVTFGGTATAGNVISLNLSWTGGSGSPQNVQYTVQGGDAVSDIALAFYYMLTDNRIHSKMLTSGGSGSFVNGETVTATGGASGTYTAKYSWSNVITAINSTVTYPKTFTGTLTGQTSGATRTITGGLPSVELQIEAQPSGNAFTVQPRATNLPVSVANASSGGVTTTFSWAPPANNIQLGGQLEVGPSTVCSRTLQGGRLPQIGDQLCTMQWIAWNDSGSNVYQAGLFSLASIGLSPTQYRLRIASENGDAVFASPLSELYVSDAIAFIMVSGTPRFIMTTTGSYANGATGSAMGDGSINAQALYVNGVAVAALGGSSGQALYNTGTGIGGISRLTSAGVFLNVATNGIVWADTSTASFGDLINFSSSTVLTANHNLVFDMGNAEHTIAFGTTGSNITFTNAAAFNVASLNLAQNFTADQSFAAKIIQAETSARAYTLKTRSGITTYPVAFLRPNTTNTTMVWDVTPNGSPSEVGTNGYAWLDVCDTDIGDSGADATCGRVGARSVAVEFGSRTFGAGTVKPIYLTINDGTPWQVIDTSGHALFGGATAQSSSGGWVELNKSQNSTLGNFVRNVNTGTTALAAFGTIAQTAQMFFGTYGDGVTSTRYGITLAGYSEIVTVAGNGLILGNGTQNKPVIVGLNSVEIGRFDATGFKLGGTAARGTTDPTSAISLFNGTVPAGTLTNGFSIYSSSGRFAWVDSAGNVRAFVTTGAAGATTIPTGNNTMAALEVAQTFTAAQSFNSGDFVLNGATSGTLTVNCASTCGSNTLTLPAGTTNFGATGGTSQVVKQTSSGGALTVARLACADLSDSTALCSTTPGTGVATALGVNVGSAGAFVTFNGALGTPSSGTVTNLTGTASININGTVGATTPTTGAFTTVAASTSVTITSASASALTVGLNGATNPAFQVDSSTASQAAGFKITGAATGGTVALAAIDSGSNTNITVNAKGTGTIGIGSVSTGAVTITPALTLSAALTYGGVTLSNAVTGTGNMVLSASPTLTGTLTAAIASFSGTINVGSGTLSNTTALVSGNSTTVSGAVVPGGTTYLQVVGGNSVAPVAAVDAFGQVAVYALTRANGTAASPTVVVNDDQIGWFAGLGYTGSGYRAAAYIAFVAKETWSSTVSGEAIDFITTAAGGNVSATALRIHPSGGLSAGTTFATDPGAGGLQLQAQMFLPNITTSSAAQTGTVCWTTGTGKFTADTTVGCLTSIGAAKNITERVDPTRALDIVSALSPVAFTYKPGYGDSGQYEQFGLIAEELAQVDERLVGRDPEGTLVGVRYQELTAILAGAIKELKADNDNLRAANDNLQQRIESIERINRR